MKNLIIFLSIVGFSSMSFAFPPENNLCVKRESGEVQCITVDKDKRQAKNITKHEVYVIKQPNGILEFSDQKKPESKIIIVNPELNMFKK